MPFIVPDVPQYVVEATTPTVVGVHVAAGTNWDLASRAPETPVARLPDPEPVQPQPVAEPVSPPADCSVQPVVYFDFNKSITSADALQHSFANLAKSCVWSVGGYTDPRGSAHYNFKLGEARAHFVARWLGNSGYKVGVVHSFGKTELVSKNPKHYDLDRRVQVEAIPSSETR